MENLYDYIFWHNHYEGNWYAIHRDDQLLFFKGDREGLRYYKSNKVDTLIELLCKPITLEKLKKVVL